MPAEKPYMKLVAGIVFAAVATTALTTVHDGSPPPDFIVTSVAGSRPLSQLRGRPVVINFWASWCPPCTDELPYFDRLNRLYGNRILLITVSDEPPGVARAYLQAHHLDLPLVEDPGGKIFDEYALPPIPGTVVLNATGDVTYISPGGLSWPELQNAVSKVL